LRAPFAFLADSPAQACGQDPARYAEHDVQRGSGAQPRSTRAAAPTQVFVAAAVAVGLGAGVARSPQAANWALTPCLTEVFNGQGGKRDKSQARKTASECV